MRTISKKVLFILRNRTRIANVGLSIMLVMMFAYLYPKTAQEVELQQQIKLLGYVVDNLDEGVMVVGLNSHVLLWNKGAERTFGVPASEVLHKDYYWMLDDLVREQHQVMFDANDFKRTSEVGKVYQINCMAKRWDKSDFAVQIRLQRVINVDGHGRPGYLVIVHDLSKIEPIATPSYPQTPPVLPQPSDK